MPRLDALTPPSDPRRGRALPAFGEMVVVEDLDELTTRVLAPNPSPMTLDGTNTYVVAVPGGGAAIVVDPGPEDRDHLAAVEGVLERRDLEAAMVVVTHRHADHTAAARAWADRFGATLAAPTREVAGSDGRLVAHGETLAVAGLRVEAVATPGHTADHTAYRLPSGALLTGDHVLGRGTSVVAHPDGDLAAYLDSLRTVLRLGADTLYPGHGPALAEDGQAVVEYYLEHRDFRQQQVLACLEDGPHTPRQLVERIYADVDPRLWDAAEASTRAALEVLSSRGRIVRRGDEAALV